ncbi:MAG TPA: hypothetical protein VM431_10040, partial [Phycisphaerae bacterium]|nr:hypothetical protein [Phycisphaerae bacterium]
SAWPNPRTVVTGGGVNPDTGVLQQVCPTIRRLAGTPQGWDIEEARPLPTLTFTARRVSWRSHAARRTGHLLPRTGYFIGQTAGGSVTNP